MNDKIQLKTIVTDNAAGDSIPTALFFIKSVE